MLGNIISLTHVCSVCSRRQLCELEEFSSTDITQAWGVTKDPAWYAPTPIRDFCHVGGNPVSQKYPPLSSAEASAVKRTLLDAAPFSAIAIHEKRQRKSATNNNPVRVTNAFVAQVIARTAGPPANTVPDGALLDSFYQSHVALTVADSERLFAETEGQNSLEWKNARRLRITASTCYQLYTYKGSNWTQLLERIMFSTFGGNRATRFGQEQEDRSRQCLQATTGADIRRCGLIIPPLMPWLGCSPDGVIIDKNTLHLLEIKCPMLKEGQTVMAAIEEKRLPYLYKHGENMLLKERHAYYAQVQLSMEIMDIDACEFCVFEKESSTNVRVKVPRNRDFGAALVSRLTYVYFSHVLPFLKSKYS